MRMMVLINHEISEILKIKNTTVHQILKKQKNLCIIRSERVVANRPPNYQMMKRASCSIWWKNRSPTRNAIKTTFLKHFGLSFLHRQFQTF